MSIGIQIPLMVGKQLNYSRLITDGENALYAGLTGDISQHSPAATNTGTEEQERILANPFYLVGIIGALLNTRVTGEGSACITMQYEFLAPVYCGDRIEFVIEVVGVDQHKHLATLRTDCYNQHQHQVIVGQAVLLVTTSMLP